MPVQTKNECNNHKNPPLVRGEVYKVISGYGAGRVFVVTSNNGPFIQYLSGTGSDGWDRLDTMDEERSKYKSIILQEV